LQQQPARNQNQRRQGHQNQRNVKLLFPFLQPSP
jgi:hypothetical protein